MLYPVLFLLKVPDGRSINGKCSHLAWTYCILWFNHRKLVRHAKSSFLVDFLGFKIGSVKGYIPFLLMNWIRSGKTFVFVTHLHDLWHCLFDLLPSRIHLTYFFWGCLLTAFWYPFSLVVEVSLEVLNVIILTSRSSLYLFESEILTFDGIFLIFDFLEFFHQSFVLIWHSYNSFVEFPQNAIVLDWRGCVLGMSIRNQMMWKRDSFLTIRLWTDWPGIHWRYVPWIVGVRSFAFFSQFEF